jgi:hypothetical protein
MPKKFPRTSMFHGEGTDPPDIVQGRIININLVRWTVDVYTTFDRKRYMDVPVSSPYQHYSNGEGLSIFPEVGSICYLCVPGDSSGPFVLAFTMPHETIDASTSDAPQGTRSRGTPTGSSDATFAGNRPKAKPGDIVLRGRDGNSIVLHRGGVLQIGANELAQRIYVPLGNLVTDIAENYQMFSAGGTISWGLQDGPSRSKFPSQYLHTFRVFANDKYADVKLAAGRVYNPQRADGSGIGNDDDNPTVLELVVKPQGFDGTTGDDSGEGEIKLQFMFDKEGNGFIGMKGALKMNIDKKWTVSAKGGIEFNTPGNIDIFADELIQVQGKSGVHVKGKVVRLGPGKRPVACMGDLVNVFIGGMPLPAQFTPTIPIGQTPSGPHPPGVPIPGTLTIGPPGGVPPFSIPGQIGSGEPTVLA